MIHLSQDNRSPGGDLNPGPPEYDAGVLSRNISQHNSSSAEIRPGYHADENLYRLARRIFLLHTFSGVNFDRHNLVITHAFCCVSIFYFMCPAVV
jgi:hypothetical protein